MEKKDESNTVEKFPEESIIRIIFGLFMAFLWGRKK